MPQVVDSLLDITKTPRKPQYTMAPELPLILRSCLFDNVSFMCSSGMSLRSSVLGATFRKYFQT
jgi:tRNA pseudouridine38/39 synthase